MRGNVNSAIALFQLSVLLCTGGVYSAVLRGAHTESPVISHIHQAAIMCVVPYRRVYTGVHISFISQ